MSSHSCRGYQFACLSANSGAISLGRGVLGNVGSHTLLGAVWLLLLGQVKCLHGGLSVYGDLNHHGDALGYGAQLLTSFTAKEHLVGAIGDVFIWFQVAVLVENCLRTSR